MPLNDHPDALSDHDYWAAFDRFKAEHPEGVQEIHADQYTTYRVDHEEPAA